MRIFGAILIAFGLLAIIYALNMSVTVRISSGYGEVNNMGLISSKNNTLMLGCFITLMGFISYCTAIIKETIEKSVLGNFIHNNNKVEIIGSEKPDALENKEEYEVPEKVDIKSLLIPKKDGFMIDDESIAKLALSIIQHNPDVKKEKLFLHCEELINNIESSLPSEVRITFMRRIKYWLEN